MRPTHLALSEPCEAPATKDEPCPLGLRWTKGLFIREGDLERTLKDKVQVGPAVGAVEERGDVHSADSEPNTGDTVHRAQTGAK